MFDKECPQCGKEFKHKERRRKFCSMECSIESHKHKRETRKCLYCGKDFEHVDSRRKSCSSECFNEYMESKREIRVCLCCGKEFKIVKTSTVKNCSKECIKKYVESKKKEVKCVICGDTRVLYRSDSRPKSKSSTCGKKECFSKLMSIQKTGKNNPNYNGTGRIVNCEVCGIEVKDRNGNKRFCSIKCKGEWQKENLKGENGTFYGRHHTKEVRMASAKRNSKGLHQNINRAIRYTYKAKEWRKEVYKRDDWRCQCCNRRGGGIYLNAHHKEFLADLIDKYGDIEEKYKVDPFSVTHDDYFYDIDNGITYCSDCHDKEHEKIVEEKRVLVV